MKNIAFLVLIAFILIYASPTLSYSYAGDDYRYSDRDSASPGAHQLASWIASQLRSKELPQAEIPALPYRLPIQGKRNSEVSNAIIGSEETQKMYRDGRK